MPAMMEIDGHMSSEFQMVGNGTVPEGSHVHEPIMDRPLFGGAITCKVPNRFRGSQRLKKRRGLPLEIIVQPRLHYTYIVSSLASFKDVSDIREVPNNQEVLCDYEREESIIIELLELKSDVSDEDSARWFLRNVAEEQEAEDTMIIEDRRVLTEKDVPNMPATTVMNAAVGYMTITKTRQFDGFQNPADVVIERPTSAQHLVKAHLASIRLRSVETDLLVTVNQKLDQRSQNPSPTSLEPTTPEAMSYLPPADLLNLVLRTLKIEDWTLFVS